MPLKPGYSRETVNANIAQMRREGHPEKNAVAASLEHARESYFKRYPQGFLPPYLILSNGRRDRAAWDRSRSRKSNPCGCRNTNPAARPTIEAMALDLVDEYRKNGEPAACKLFDKMSREYDLMKKDENVLKREFNRMLIERRPNPVPPSKHVQRRNASELYKNFTGHEALDEIEIEKPELPDVMLVVGDIDGVMYTTVRDDKVEKYIHKFKKKARPLFCVSHDGKQIHLIGGEYDFTERGIVDRT